MEPWNFMCLADGNLIRTRGKASKSVINVSRTRLLKCTTTTFQAHIRYTCVQTGNINVRTITRKVPITNDHDQVEAAYDAEAGYEPFELVECVNVLLMYYALCFGLFRTTEVWKFRRFSA